jgi:hypothetical protein
VNGRDGRSLRASWASRSVLSMCRISIGLVDYLSYPVCDERVDHIAD